MKIEIEVKNIRKNNKKINQTSTNSYRIKVKSENYNKTVYASKARLASLCGGAVIGIVNKEFDDGES